MRGPSRPLSPRRPVQRAGASIGEAAYPLPDELREIVCASGWWWPSGAVSLWLSTRCCALVEFGCSGCPGGLRRLGRHARQGNVDSMEAAERSIAGPVDPTGDLAPLPSAAVGFWVDRSWSRSTMPNGRLSLLLDERVPSRSAMDGSVCGCGDRMGACRGWHGAS